MEKLSLWDTTGLEDFDFKQIKIPIDHNFAIEPLEQLLSKELSTMFPNDTFDITISKSNIVIIRSKSSNKVVCCLLIPPNHNSSIKTENNLNLEEILKEQLQDKVVRLKIEFPEDIEHNNDFTNDLIFRKNKECTRKEQRMRRKELRKRNPTQHQKRR